MFFLSLLSFIPRLILGFSMIHMIWNPLSKNYLLIKMFLSGAIGFGISSLFSFLWIWSGFNIFTYVIIEFLLALFLVIYFLCKNFEKINLINLQTLFQYKSQFFAFFILAISVFAFGFFLITNGFNFPHGNMDAWMNWNVVSRFIYRGGEDWKNTFLRALGHPDYPFFVPLTNVVTWGYVQKDTFLAPIAFHFVFSFLMLGLLFSFVKALKNFQQAILITILFIALPITTMGMSQLADFPLAYIILAIGGLTLLYFKTKQTQLLILIGFLTGLAAWTKNEGIILVLNNTILWCIIAFFNGRENLKRYILGLLFPLVVVILFKIFLAPENDVVSGAQNILENTLNIDRILYILKNFGATFLGVGGGISLVSILLLYIIIVGKSSESISGIWAIVFMALFQLFSYFITYLITPHDLNWHIKTSMNRLTFHVLPLILLGMFCWLKSPEELWMKKEA